MRWSENKCQLGADFCQGDVQNLHLRQNHHKKHNFLMKQHVKNWTCCICFFLWISIWPTDTKWRWMSTWCLFQSGWCQSTLSLLKTQTKTWFFSKMECENSVRAQQHVPLDCWCGQKQPTQDTKGKTLTWCWLLKWCQNHSVSAKPNTKTLCFNETACHKSVRAKQHVISDCSQEQKSQLVPSKNKLQLGAGFCQ